MPTSFVLVDEGGAGSGHWGHKGRKGKKGGALPGGLPSKLEKGIRGARRIEARILKNKVLVKELIRESKAHHLMDALGGMVGQPNKALQTALSTAVYGHTPKGKEKNLARSVGRMAGRWFMGPTSGSIVKGTAVGRLAMKSLKTGKLPVELQAMIAVSAVLGKKLDGKSTTLYRGMGYVSDSKFGKSLQGSFPKKGTTSGLPTRALSSWSSKKGIAKEFANYQGEDMGSSAVFQTKASYSKDVVVLNYHWMRRGSYKAYEHVVMSTGVQARRVA